MCLCVCAQRSSQGSPLPLLSESSSQWGVLLLHKAQEDFDALIVQNLIVPSDVEFLAEKQHMTAACSLTAQSAETTPHEILLVAFESAVGQGHTSVARDSAGMDNLGVPLLRMETFESTDI